MDVADFIPAGQAIPVKDRISVTVQIANEATGVSRSVLYEMIKAEELESTTVRGRRLIFVDSLLAVLGKNRTRRKAA